jgi:DNA-binding response OmpR family regulator
MGHGALRVLIVEDEPLLGMELEEVVTLAGHAVVGWATNRANALALGDARSPDIAFVDFRLLDGDTGLELSQRLSERGVAVVLTTANATDHVGKLDHALGIVSKPYSAETIHAVLRDAAEKLDSGGTAPNSVPEPQVKSNE